MSIIEQIKEGEYDTELGKIVLAASERRQTLKKAKENGDSKSVTEFVEVVRENPGITVTQAAMIMGVSGSRVYQIAEEAKHRVRVSKDYPRRFRIINKRSIQPSAGF